jgi:hypothetical protein
MKNINGSWLSIELLKKMRAVLIVILFLIVLGSYSTTLVQALSIPSLKIEPKSINFGAITVGLSSPGQTVTITNDWDSTNVLVIHNIYLDGPDADSYTIINDNCSGKTLDGSISSTLEVVFKPDSAGSKNAILMIPSNATSWPYEVVLSGTGIAVNDNQTPTPTLTPTPTPTLTPTPTPTDSETGTISSTNQTSKPGDDNSPANWPLIIVIIVVVVVIIGLVLVRRLLRK